MELDEIGLADPCSTPKRALSTSSTDETPVVKKRITDSEEIPETEEMSQSNQDNDNKQSIEDGQQGRENTTESKEGKKGKEEKISQGAEQSGKEEILAAITGLRESMKADINKMKDEIRAVKEQVPKEVEKKIKKIAEDFTLEMAAMTAKVEAIEVSISDLSKDFAAKLALMDNRVQALEFKAAAPRPREPYNIDDTLVVTGVPYSPGEDVQAKMKVLIQTHLKLSDVTIARAKRTPWRNNRPGIVKVQLGNLDEKIRVLRAKATLKTAPDIPSSYRKVYIRASKSHEQRLMELNLREMMRYLPCEEEYRFTGSGRLVRKNDGGQQPPEASGLGTSPHQDNMEESEDHASH